MLQRLTAEHGDKWKVIGAAMGRAGYACRDKWRMMKNSPKGGDWTSEEIAKLRELVDEYFQQRFLCAGTGMRAVKGTSTSRCGTTSTGRRSR